jgi:mevalonate kinase
MQGKLTGAGGGGFAFALIPPSLTDQTLAAAQQELTAKGYTCSQERRCFGSFLAKPKITNPIKL